jgi:hypothetical protein
MFDALLGLDAVIAGVETREEAVALATPGQKVNILMGQTFDHGQPLDLLKYALFMMEAVDELRAAGAVPTATWVVADHFLTHLNQDLNVATADELAEQRCDYLRRINEAYHGNLGIVRTSELRETPKYRDVLQELRGYARSHQEFADALLAAVPVERRADAGSREYPLEEIATVVALGTDVKVGPLMERSYDEPARRFLRETSGRGMVSVYVTRSEPFGQPGLGPELAAEIERIGVLPYKLNSKGSAACRIDPLHDPVVKVDRLLNSTLRAAPLLDLLAIGALAQRRLEGSSPDNFLASGTGWREYLSGGCGSSAPFHNERLGILRSMASTAYRRFVLEPLVPDRMPSGRPV